MACAEKRISGMIKHQILWELLILPLPVVWQVQLREKHTCFSESITFSHLTSLKENTGTEKSQSIKWQNRDQRVLLLVKSQGTRMSLQNYFCFFCMVILTTPVLFNAGHLNVPKLCKKWLSYAEKISRCIYYTFVTLFSVSHSGKF